MIEVKIEHDGPNTSKCLCGIEGDLKTLTRETLEVIHAIYKAMAEDGGPPPALATFQLMVIMAVCDPNSAVWDLGGEVSVVEKKGREAEEAMGKEDQP